MKPLPNPYEHELPAEQLVLSRSSAWVLTVIFLLLISVPSAWLDYRERLRADGWIPAVEFAKTVSNSVNSSQNIELRLRGFEHQLEQHLVWSVPMRQFAQSIQNQVFKAGNHKVIMGRDGWLFYRPEMEALTGYGPLLDEPRSVASNPLALQWQPPTQSIVDYAKALQAHGIQLWMMPVPMKECIYPEGYGAVSSEPITHPSQPAFYAELRAHGVEIIELERLFWSMKSEDAAQGPVYLRTDTHWSQRAMVAAAERITQHLHRETSSPQNLLAVWKPRTQAGKGDLLEKLDLGDDAMPEAEWVNLRLPPENKSLPWGDVALIGDSFVNIYHDPSLGFGGGAGLGEVLMALLGQRVDVIAINGGGASEVRQRLAIKSPDELAKAKHVVWVLAARDLFLGRSEALANQVHWDDVKFTDKPKLVSKLGQILSGAATATVTEISPVGAEVDPQLTTYPSATIAVKYRVTSVATGELPAEDIIVYHWLFQKRRWQAASKLQVGQQVDLQLSLWTDQHPAFSASRVDVFKLPVGYWSDL